MSCFSQNPNFTTKVAKIEPRMDTNKHELLENCFFQSFVSIGVHSWFGKYDIVELNCILLFLLSWIIVTAFGALCYKNFRFFLFDACSRQPLP